MKHGRPLQQLLKPGQALAPLTTRVERQVPVALRRPRRREDCAGDRHDAVRFVRPTKRHPTVLLNQNTNTRIQTDINAMRLRRYPPRPSGTSGITPQSALSTVCASGTTTATVSLSALHGSASSTGNDPSAGSPTETLLRLLLPLNDQVRASSRPTAPPGEGRAETNPMTSLNRSIGSSDGRCVQRAGT